MLGVFAFLGDVLDNEPYMELLPAILPKPLSRRPVQGRDELNLADFPISVLQHQQPKDDTGRKLDTVIYQATRYDTHIRQRVPQRVTLTTSSRYGLPTPADEDVVLSLLCLGKRVDNFASTRVHFIPHELFRIMRWSANARGYQRLRDVLRRLKALTIIYENAWWDGAGRRYEEELATGIVAEYRIIHQSRGRTKNGEVPPSWVEWTPRFHQSLADGNLKALDLELVFKLRLPTSRRMYRFLDKRFHGSSIVELDLMDFACGHIGLTEARNVATIKQRLAPAIKELEEIGFIEPTNRQHRYKKIRRGIWRILFTRKRAAAQQGIVQPPLALPAPQVSPAGQLVTDFYRVWRGIDSYKPSRRELEQAEKLIEQYSLAKVQAMLPAAIARLRTKWPDARTFTALVSYMGEVANEHDRQQRRETHRREQMRLQHETQQRMEQQVAKRKQFEAKWRAEWNQLPESQRQAIRSRIIANSPWLARIPSLLESQCLQEIAKRFDHDAAA